MRPPLWSQSPNPIRPRTLRPLPIQPEGPGPRVRLPARDRAPGYTGALLKKNEPGLRFADAPSFILSQQLKEFVRSHPFPMKGNHIGQAVNLVRQAPLHMHNTVVWNQILHLLGREHKLDAMFKNYNDVSSRRAWQRIEADPPLSQMKKRGIRPSMKTYSTMLNAHSGIPHDHATTGFDPLVPPTQRQIQRVVEIYNQSQVHISEQIAIISRARRAGNANTPVAPGIMGTDTTPAPGDKELEEISLAPTNAYLKFLAKYGMWSQIEKVRLALDKTGPLSPDNVTYTTMFHALLNRIATTSQRRYSEVNLNSGASDFGKKEMGEIARDMWDTAVRAFHPVDQSQMGSPDHIRMVDGELAITALQCLLAGRPGDAQLALELIPFLWNIAIPDPERPASALGSNIVSPRTRVTVPCHMSSIPEIPIDIASATAIVSMLAKHKHNNAAAKYAKYFLNHPSLAGRIDFPFLKVAVYGLSVGEDVETIVRIMDNHQPPTGVRSWPMYIWEDAMFACRSSGRYEIALDILRRMTQIPHGVEDAAPKTVRSQYKWKLPNGKETDEQGRKWYRPDPIFPSAKVMTAFLQTALSSNQETYIPTLNQAYNVLLHFNLGKLFSVADHAVRGREGINLLKPPTASEFVNNSVVRAAEWQMNLAKDTQRLVDILIRNAPVGPAPAMVELRGKLAEIRATWGKVLVTGMPAAHKEKIRPTSARELYEQTMAKPKKESGVQPIGSLQGSPQRARGMGNDRSMVATDRSSDRQQRHDMRVVNEDLDDDEEEEEDEFYNENQELGEEEDGEFDEDNIQVAYRTNTGTPRSRDSDQSGRSPRTQSGGVSHGRTRGGRRRIGA